MADSTTQTASKTTAVIEIQIGEYACLKGRLRRETLDAALSELSNDRQQGRPERSLREVLISYGAITEAEWRATVESSAREQAERAAVEEENLENNLLGRLLYHRGWVTEPQVNEALRLQAAMSTTGRGLVPRLGTILVELGYLSHEQAEKIPQLVRRAFLSCPACGWRVEIAGYESELAYRCPQCGGALREATTPVSPDERAAGPDLLFERILPRDVEAVIDDATRRFGKYILIDILGRGGMAIVYRAWDPEQRRFLALKIFDPGEDKEEDAQSFESDLKRFIREGRTASRLKHPNIVSVYEAGVIDHRYYIAMEYIAGATLEGVIRENARPIWKGRDAQAAIAATGRQEPARGTGRLPPRRAAELVRDVALAVHFAHRHGVLHRDIKPQNVLIDPTGQPHITDFGIAIDLRKRHRTAGTTTEVMPRIEPPTCDISVLVEPGAPANGDARKTTAALTLDGFVVGTPAYMAPEQLGGDRNLNARTDVYGLGTILYEALTGRPPFSGDTVDKTIALVLDSTVTPPREITRDLLSPDIEAICLKALAKDRSVRYESALDMAQDLERFLRGEPVSAHVPRRSTAFMTFKADPRRIRILLWVLGAEFAAIAALVARLLGWW